MNINKAINREKVINSDIKLSKAAEKIMNGDRKVIEKSLYNYKVNDWMGLAQNPLLTDKDIRHMYAELNNQYSYEKADKSVKEATKTRNSGQRGKVKRLLAVHPSLEEKTIMSLLNGKSIMGAPKVLNNPNVTKEMLDLYFEKRIMTTAQGKGYNFVSFKDLMKTKNVTKEIVLGWYRDLVKYADWTLEDNQWYAIIDSYLSFDDCPFEVLKDIVKIPADTKEGFFNRPERYREAVVKHKNATPELTEIAYEISKDEKYLPQSVKDVFIF